MGRYWTLAYGINRAYVRAPGQPSLKLHVLQPAQAQDHGFEIDYVLAPGVAFPLGSAAKSTQGTQDFA